MNEGSGFQDSYAGGSAAGGNGAFVGGLVGVNKDNGGASTPTIQSSYSTTAVNAGSDAMVGGLIGQDLAQTGTTNAYWDLDISGVSDPTKGAGNVPNDPGITGLTSTELQSGLPTGFDPKIWKQNPAINSGFPYLSENPPQ